MNVTSEVPIPNAKHPNAPCVAVLLSPHTIVVPGSVNPCSGPITCTIPSSFDMVTVLVTVNDAHTGITCDFLVVCLAAQSRLIQIPEITVKVTFVISRSSSFRHHYQGMTVIYDAHSSKAVHLDVVF